MKCEQAFYTRRDGSGFTIAAQSKEGEEFKKICEAIGSKTVDEKHQEPVELIYYAESTENYVGMGITPISYENIEGKNKLVHIYVPEKSLKDSMGNTSAYYLPYTFRGTVAEPCEGREISPDFSEALFLKELNERFDEEKLACFLWKYFPVMIKERTSVEIVLSKEYSREEFFYLARKLTWLLSGVLPIPAKAEREKLEALKQLSYSAYAIENSRLANLVYVTKQQESEEACFFLDKTTEESVPEVYRKLAKQALESREGYEKFLEELWECRMQARMTDEELQLSYLYWQLKNNDHMVVKAEELPIDITILRRRAERNEKYCSLLYLLIGAVDGLEKSDVEALCTKIFMPVEDLSWWENERFQTACVRLLNAVYNEKKEVYENFWNIIREKSPQVQSSMIEQLYRIEDSCVRKEIKAISSTNFLDKLKKYEILIKEESFQDEIEEKLISEELYFDEKTAVRQGIRLLLEQNSLNPEKWIEKISEKIVEKMQSENWKEFFAAEIPYLENELASVYSRQFLEKYQNYKIMTVKEQQAQLSDLGKQFFEKCPELKEDRKNFEKETRKWRMKALTGSWPEFQNEVQRFEKKKKNRSEDQEKLREQLDEAWEVLNTTEKQLYWSWKFKGCYYSIWNTFETLGLEKFQEIYNILSNKKEVKDAVGFVENTRVEKLTETKGISSVDYSSELRRNSYLLWKELKIGTHKFDYQLEAFEDDYRDDIVGFLDKLLTTVCNQPKRDEDYITRLEIRLKKAFVENPFEPRLVTEFEVYHQLKTEKGEEYSRLFEILKENQIVLKRIGQSKILQNIKRKNEAENQIKVLERLEKFEEIENLEVKEDELLQVTDHLIQLKKFWGQELEETRQYERCNFKLQELVGEQEQRRSDLQMIYKDYSEKEKILQNEKVTIEQDQHPKLKGDKETIQVSEEEINKLQQVILKLKNAYKIKKEGLIQEVRGKQKDLQTEKLETKAQIDAIDDILQKNDELLSIKVENVSKKERNVLGVTRSGMSERRKSSDHVEETNWGCEQMGNRIKHDHETSLVEQRSATTEKKSNFIQKTIVKGSEISIVSTETQVNILPAEPTKSNREIEQQNTYQATGTSEKDIKCKKEGAIIDSDDLIDDVIRKNDHLSVDVDDLF